jgi:hypothetical protein
MRRWMLAGIRALALVAALVALTAPWSATTVRAAGPKPTDGWTLHIDAKLHFPGKPDMIAHHYCKPVSGGLTECQLYDGDAPDARLVGVEVIVGPDAHKKFGKAEQGLWHYHKVEIPKVSATLPDLTKDEADKVVKDIENTYGKIYLLWDPAKQELPTGRPSVTVLK